MEPGENQYQDEPADEAATPATDAALADDDALIDGAAPADDATPSADDYVSADDAAPIADDAASVDGAPAADEPTAREEAPAEPETAGAGPAATQILPAPGGEERTWAVLAHMLVIGGYMTGFGWLGWVGPLVVWVKRRHLGPYVAFHALQSLLFQLAWTGAFFVGIRAAVMFPELMYAWFYLGAVPVIWCVIGACKAHLGEWYEYPLVGRWAMELTDQEP
ncbi:MAG: hypothetical protein K0Q72_2677 [Armatimonadetes bacterium]|jgi:uncharacterized Tic20 family protein|nr:hypothetical protein [Armatimonadota bacterium]